MIHDCTNGELDKIKAFVRENHLAREFVSSFRRFKRDVREGFEVFLYPDLAPHSLTFTKQCGNGYKTVGGFIFHDSSSSTNPFSVEVNPSSKPHWSIHT